MPVKEEPYRIYNKKQETRNKKQENKKQEPRLDFANA